MIKSGIMIKKNRTSDSEDVWSEGNNGNRVIIKKMRKQTRETPKNRVKYGILL